MIRRVDQSKECGFPGAGGSGSTNKVRAERVLRRERAIGIEGRRAGRPGSERGSRSDGG